MDVPAAFSAAVIVPRIFLPCGYHSREELTEVQHGTLRPVAGEIMKKRNGSIDFWKFIFSVIVVMFHSSNLTKVKDTPFVGGAIAVEFFFLVSGYLMAESISRYREEDVLVGRDSRRFLLHKIRGLCPEIFVAWFIGYVVQHTAKDGVTLKTLLRDLLTGVWDMFFLRESGLTGFKANNATWYISAMLLAMLILVPLFFRNRDMFLNVWAPVIAIATLGYLCKNVGDLRGPTDWLGFCYKGLMRAVGELCVGSMCWGVARSLKKVKFTAAARWLFAALEWGCYLAVIVWSYRHKGSEMDFVMLLLFAVAVTITFCEFSPVSYVFNNNVVYWFGKISFPLYLGHNYWSHMFLRTFPGKGYWQLMPYYAVAVVVTTAVIYLTSVWLRRAAPVFLAACRKVFLSAP